MYRIATLITHLSIFIGSSWGRIKFSISSRKIWREKVNFRIVHTSLKLLRKRKRRRSIESQVGVLIRKVRWGVIVLLRKIWSILLEWVYYFVIVGLTKRSSSKNKGNSQEKIAHGLSSFKKDAKEEIEGEEEGKKKRVLANPKMWPIFTNYRRIFSQSELKQLKKLKVIQ